jgi:hypothetical protein
MDLENVVSAAYLSRLIIGFEEVADRTQHVTRDRRRVTAALDPFVSFLSVVVLDDLGREDNVAEFDVVGIEPAIPKSTTIFG